MCGAPKVVTANLVGFPGSLCENQRSSRQDREQSPGIGVVAEGAAEVDEEIAIPGSEDEAGAELERILPQAVLAMAGSPGTGPCFGVIPAEDVEQVPGFQFRGFVSGPLGIDQQRERDAGLLAKQAGVVHVAQADGSQRGSGLFELVLVFAQLRDMLAAEDSAVVAQEDNHGGIPLPQRAEADLASARFGQHDVRQGRADGFRHRPDCTGSWRSGRPVQASVGRGFFSSRLLKKYFLRGSLTAAAKAGAEKTPVIAALKRCATQNQARDRVFPQPARGSKVKIPTSVDSEPRNFLASLRVSTGR